jgi:hypothetical protein
VSLVEAPYPQIFNITAPPKVLSREEAMLVKSSEDLIVFGKLFLKADFQKTETPGFHYEIAAALTDKTTRKQTAIIVPRGHGKTTLVKAYILQSFLFNQYFDKSEVPLFFGWVSDSLSKSYRNVGYLKEHLDYNARILRYFGKMRGDKWTEQDIKLSNGCTLISRSNAKSIRGETAGSVEGGSQRYHRILLDDMENEDNTNTFEARDKLKNILSNAIFPALDNTSGRLIFTGTPVHNDSLCQNILDGYKKAMKSNESDDFSWLVITYKATQPAMPGGVLWNSYFPRTRLDEIRKFYEDMGRLPGYYQEYELEPSGGTTRIWTPDHYLLHDAAYQWDAKERVSILQWRGQRFPVNCFIGCDPATDIATRTSDYSVITALAIDNDQRIFVLEYVEKLAIPQAAMRDAKGEILEGATKGIVDYIWDLYYQYHCLSATVEDVAMTRGVLQDIEKLKMTLNKWDLVCIPEAPGGREKINRIVHGLNSFFSYRKMHVRQDHYSLREQIETIGPKMKHDDVIDSLFLATRHMTKPTEFSTKQANVIRTKVPLLRRNWKLL